jgi:copper chaperone CopZ
MKSTLKMGNMVTYDDVNKVRNAISNKQGVMACQINLEKSELNVVYDDYFVQLDDLILALEEEGYTIL